MSIPRSEYPRPQFVRQRWQNLTDVQQEQNGLLTFDRKHKFDPARIRAIHEIHEGQ